MDDDILEDSFDQISSFNIIHRGIHARSTTGTEISKETVKGSVLQSFRVHSSHSQKFIIIGLLGSEE